MMPGRGWVNIGRWRHAGVAAVWLGCASVAGAAPTGWVARALAAAGVQQVAGEPGGGAGAERGGRAGRSATRGTLSLAEWLVEEGRDYAASEEHIGTDVDGIVVLTYMQAAARVDAELAPAQRWQYEILLSLGRTEEAEAALRRYIEISPDDIPAHLTYIQRRYERLQTAEQRVGFCEEYLKTPGLPDAVVSDLHRRIGEILLGRGEREAARRHLKEAVARFHENRLAADLLEAEPFRERGRVVELLRALARNPGQPEVAWELGRELDRLGAGRWSKRFYDHALALYRQADPGSPNIVRILVDMGWGAFQRAEYGNAQAWVTEALQQAYASPDARVLQRAIAQAVRKAGSDQVAEEQLTWLNTYFESLGLRVFLEQLPEYAVDLALFYLLQNPQPERAEQFARYALEADAGDVLARAALGYALCLQDQTEAAEALLTPLADREPLAALGLARLRLRQNREAEAVALLQKTVAGNYPGPITWACIELLRSLHAEIPRPTLSAEEEAALEAFDERLLAFPRNPTQFAHLTVEFEGQPFSAIAPTRAWFALHNVGGFALLLGKQAMLDPEVALSISVDGDYRREFPAYFRTDLGRQPVLAPGALVQVGEIIDTGPLRRLLFSAPQAELRIRVNVRVSPLLKPDGTWTTRYGGWAFNLPEVRRSALVVTSDRFQRWLEDTRARDAAVRLPALLQLLRLYIERQRLDAKDFEYVAVRVNPERFRGVLVRHCWDRDRMVRLHLLSALRWAHLDDEWIGQLAALVDDSDWVVRLTAARLLASQQGPAALPVLRQMAGTDADDLVRQLAGALATKISLYSSVRARP